MVQTGSLKPPSYSGDYKSIGDASQEIVKAWLAARPDVVRVDDVSSDPEWQAKDVDFLLYTKDRNEPYQIEVKGDAHLGVSGNVLFEALRINHTAPEEHAIKLGWSVYSRADYFIFHAISVNELWLCKSIKFRQAMQQHTRKARKSTRLSLVSTDLIKSTVNILIPVDQCEGVFKKYSLDTQEAKAA